ncbi:MAG: glycine cleavage system protein GcvH [Planctomycetes bacterium]|nr:glycine cleavage system protein GcvH [Planctomycetota bacterium]
MAGTYPALLKYSTTHEWVLVSGDVATVGITAHAVEQLGDLVYVDLPKPGRALKAKEPFGEIESVKAVSDLVSPVSGTVLEVNGALSAALDAIADDPYVAGWMIKVRVAGGAPQGLLDADAYARHVESAH